MIALPVKFPASKSTWEVAALYVQWNTFRHNNPFVRYDDGLWVSIV
jgi:hypothetical protein